MLYLEWFLSLEEDSNNDSKVPPELVSPWTNPTKIKNIVLNLLVIVLSFKK